MGELSRVDEEEEALTRHCLTCNASYATRRTRQQGLTPHFPLHNRYPITPDFVVDTESESIKTISREEKQAQNDPYLSLASKSRRWHCEW